MSALPAGSVQTDGALAEGRVFTAFGHEPFWLILVKVVAVFVLLLLLTLFSIWAERRVVARMQQRSGPNRVGPAGMLQSLADGVKLMLKEDIVPAMADKAVYILAPIASAIPAFLSFAVIPFGPEVSIGGHHTGLQLTDLPVGVLFVLASASLGVYGLVLSGWASGSTYPLLGGLRAAAQLISYEIAMGLALVAVFLYSGTMSTQGIVSAQHDLWFSIQLIPSFLLYVVAAVGETNRAPFDLPEGESEIVGGFHTEYSSIKFAFFFLAEYINMITVSALATTLFLGGWRAPWPLSVGGTLNSGWWPLLWFTAKVLVVLFMFVWLRATLPRLRYDQFMGFGWKILIPGGLVWVMAAAYIRLLANHVPEAGKRAALIAVPFLVLFLAASALYERADRRRRAGKDARAAEDMQRAGSLEDLPWPPRTPGVLDAGPPVLTSTGEPHRRGD